MVGAIGVMKSYGENLKSFIWYWMIDLSTEAEEELYPQMR
jgi:hypothetical protein